MVMAPPLLWRLVKEGRLEKAGSLACHKAHKDNFHLSGEGSLGQGRGSEQQRRRGYDSFDVGGVKQVQFYCKTLVGASRH